MTTPSQHGSPQHSSPENQSPPLAVMPAIHWPERYLPAVSAVHVTNQIVIPASPADIWAWLLRAELWPSWYTNAHDIHFLSHTGPDLRDRSRFRWKTFGLRITSKVLEFEPCSRLAWDAHGMGVEAWHAWVLTPLRSDGSGPRTRVVSEETQHGWLARLSHRFAPTRIATAHQQWLQALSDRAASGPPQ